MGQLQLKDEACTAAAPAIPLPETLRRPGERAEVSAARVKRALDVCVASVMLLALAPCLGFVALAIFLTSGRPILFRQRRVGKGGVEFTLYKFRSMKNGSWGAAHQKRVEQQIFAPQARRRFQRPFAGPDRRSRDFNTIPRSQMTVLGPLLRKTSLDELPQLINVVKGDMSLVGPRPPIPYEIASHAPEQLRRLSVPPGLTGLWQVSGRSRLNYLEMINLDLEYVETHSLCGDFKILLQTPWAVIESWRR